MPIEPVPIEPAPVVPGSIAAVVTETTAAESARIVSTLIRMTGDFDLAEDCLQDALAKAVVEWPASGVPDNPGAWLTTVAKNRAIDLLRRASAETRALQRMAHEPVETTGEMGNAVDIDDRLTLIFTCCHPALSMDARVALTLRTVAGLSTAEIARAFLVTESTMEKRLVRTRARIRHTGLPYRVPPPERMPERRDGVLAVLYLLFTEGYSASGGESPMRLPLLDEAIRLTRLLEELMPADAEVRGLLALMLVQTSRSAARLDPSGNLLTLEEQDRTLWDESAIFKATSLLGVRRGHAGRYELQARIAACHALAESADKTDFALIASLYAELGSVAPSPVVELNRAIAVAMSEGIPAGLAIVDRLEERGELDGYHLLNATRADLLRRLGERRMAAGEYEKAWRIAPTEAERRYLERRIAQVTG